MREYTLSCGDIMTRRQFHEAIAGVMNFPEYYGGNLDALFDQLTEIGEETCLILTEWEELDQNIHSFCSRLERVLEDACRENPAFHYQIR